MSAAAQSMPRKGAPGSGRLDLVGGPIATTLIAFSLPTLGANILQSLNGSINAIWVGRILGEGALAATSNANLVMFLMFAALFGLGMAATIMIGQLFGRGDVDGVRRVMGSMSGLFLALSLLIAIVGYFEAPRLLRLLATPAEALGLANTYLRVIFLAMPPIFLVTLITMSLRGTGDSITPLIWMIVTVILDVGLNPVLIIGLGPFPPLGIAGSALATLIASYAGLVGLIIHIYLRDMPVRLCKGEWRYLWPDRAVVRTVVGKGIPMTIQMLILSGSGLIMIGLINREGVVVTAAYGVVSQLWNYVSMPTMAVGAAVSAMTAQNIGANRWDRVSSITRWGLAFTVGVTATMVVTLALVDRWALGLFLGPQSPALPIAEHIQLLATWSFLMFGVTFVLFGTVRANGAVWPPVIILLLTMVPMRLGLAWVGRSTFGQDALWLSFPASSMLTMLLTIAYFRRGTWKRARMIDPSHEAPPLHRAE